MKAHEMQILCGFFDWYNFVTNKTDKNQGENAGREILTET